MGERPHLHLLFFQNCLILQELDPEDENDGWLGQRYQAHLSSLCQSQGSGCIAPDVPFSSLAGVTHVVAHAAVQKGG